MTGTVDERLAAALCASRPPEVPDGVPLHVDDECRALGRRVIAALADSGVVLVDEDRLTEALYSFHSWEPETARSEAGAIMRALRRDLRVRDSR